MALSRCVCLRSPGENASDDVRTVRTINGFSYCSPTWPRRGARALHAESGRGGRGARFATRNITRTINDSPCTRTIPDRARGYLLRLETHLHVRSQRLDRGYVQRASISRVSTSRLTIARVLPLSEARTSRDRVTCVFPIGTSELSRSVSPRRSPPIRALGVSPR